MFIKISDEKLLSLDDFVLPVEWWSRPFEYKFCSNYLQKEDEIIDAACGIEHPFKNYAESRVKEITAIDKDERIKELIESNMSKTLKYKFGSITNTFDLVGKQVNKIFCISVFEHITAQERLLTLRSFYDALKDDGRLIMTCDYPLITPHDLLALCKETKFEWINYNENWEEELKNDDILKYQYMNLKVFKVECKKVDLNDKEKEKKIKDEKINSRKKTPKKLETK